jgi:hypothetical protein
MQGRIQGGGAQPGARTPLKLEKIWIFWRKIVILHMKYPNNFARPPPKIGKIWFFGVKSWFFTRNTPKIFAPPFARRNFYKCVPLTWNPGSAPVILIMSCYTGFFKVRRGWQSLNTGPRFYLRLICRTGWLWIYTSRTSYYIKLFHAHITMLYPFMLKHAYS